MRKIREVLRLRYEFGLSHQNIATSIKVGETTIATYLERAKKAGVKWPLPEDMDDEVLEKRLFPHNPLSNPRAEPNFPYIHKELKKKGVTLKLLWEEYLEEHPQGYQYVNFTLLYKNWASKHKVWMPQQHKPAKKPL